jgi:dUTP pyrophosphatase
MKPNVFDEKRREREVAEIEEYAEDATTNLEMLGYIPLPFRRVDKSLPGPLRDSTRNAGFDLFARIEGGEWIVAPGEVVRIPLNVSTEIPPVGVGFLFQRSSTYAKWGLKLTNGVGVIDSLYSGTDDEWAGEFKNEKDKFVTVKNGDKICQAVFIPTLPVIPVEYEKLGDENRGGFGTSPDNATDI